MSNVPFDKWAYLVEQTNPVLVVDDQAVMTDLVRRMLTRLGLENIDQTSDGSEALAMLQIRKHKLVISDLHMEGMGGIQLLKAVRADEQLKKTPFILMTGSADVLNVLTARRAGTDAYLLKPFTQEQLKAKMCEVLS